MSHLKDRYQPYSDLRFYPGANVDSERKEALAKLAVEPDELTADDIAWELGAKWTRSTYLMWLAWRERYGDEVASEIAEEYGYQTGKHNLATWMKSHSVTKMTPELWARFQDNRHALGGARHAESVVTIEDDQVTLHRTGCGYYDNRPEGAPSFCVRACDGFFRAYHDVDPTVEASLVRCRALGDSSACEIHFQFSGDDA